jgi:glycosyltransferase involved in cell wall biosynthesis
VRRWLKENPQVKEKVHFLPFRKDAVKLMADFDVLLLTSDAEGMPLVVLEALNQGVPVVSTDVGCVREMIERHFLGNSPEELARILMMIFCVDLKVNMRGRDLSSFVESYRSLYITD